MFFSMSIDDLTAKTAICNIMNCNLPCDNLQFALRQEAFHSNKGCSSSYSLQVVLDDHWSGRIIWNDLMENTVLGSSSKVYLRFAVLVL